MDYDYPFVMKRKASSFLHLLILVSVSLGNTYVRGREFARLVVFIESVNYGHPIFLLDPSEQFNYDVLDIELAR